MEFGFLDISLVSVLVKNIEDFDLISKLLDQYKNTLLTVLLSVISAAVTSIMKNLMLMMGSVFLFLFLLQKRYYQW